MTGWISGQRRSVPVGAPAKLQRKKLRLFLFFRLPQAHTVEPKRCWGANRFAVTAARMVTMAVRDPGSRARIRAIQPQINLGKIDAVRTKLNLHAIPTFEHACLLVQYEPLSLDKNAAKPVDEFAHLFFRPNSPVHHNRKRNPAVLPGFDITAKCVHMRERSGLGMN